MAELQDSVTAKETEIAELKNQIDDLQYELEKVTLHFEFFFRLEIGMKSSYLFLNFS